MEERIETFTALINKIGRNIRKIKNREMGEYSLKGPHTFCIYYLYFHGSLTATELSERCEEDKATISRAIDYLIENGFVRRTDADDKRYNVRLSLTEKGFEAGDKLSEKVNRVLSMAGEGLTEEERSHLYRALSLISENLEKVAADQATD